MRSTAGRRFGLLLVSCGPWLAAGCGDDVQGHLRLLVVPHHQGRGAVQDPFQLVQQVEVGLTDDQGGFHSLGLDAPLASFGPGLLGAGLAGAPTLVGRNDRGRAVSLGFGEPLELSAGLDASCSVAFTRLDHAVARPWREEVSAEVPAVLPPALWLDLQSLESGALDGPADASALGWLTWSPGALHVWLRIQDDAVVPAASGAPPESGDALRVYLDGLADGLAGGGDDLIWTIGADGRVSPEDGSVVAAVEPGPAGYDVRLELPIAADRKNSSLGLDLRLWDADGGGTSSVLTWVFDPRDQGAEPEPAGFGRVVLAPALLDLLPAEQGPSGVASLAGGDGPARLSGAWSAVGLRLEAEVPDDLVEPAWSGPELAGADRVELWLDLANGEPPAPELHRIHRLVVTAGGEAAHAAGAAPGSVSGSGVAFTGAVMGTQTSSGYRVEAEIPWADLDLPSGPQRGWFLGLEVVIQDEDGAGATARSWSGRTGEPELWHELRLFSVE